MPEFCVYTTMLGDYEQLNEQHHAKQSDIEFICLTDDKNLHSDTWQTVFVDPIFELDPIRAQRCLKIKPHLYVNQYRYSIYIDNAVILKCSPKIIFEQFQKEHGLMMLTHSFRETVLDEFIEVVRNGMDDQGRVFEQLNHYSMIDEEILSERPLWGGLMVRDHHHPGVRQFGEHWLNHVNRYSRRDQLSINLCLKKSGLRPQILDLSNHESPYHSWPHIENRDRNRGMRDLSVSLQPLVAKNRKLQLQNQSLSKIAADLKTTDEDCRILSQKYEVTFQALTEMTDRCLLRESELSDMHRSSQSRLEDLKAQNERLDAELRQTQQRLAKIRESLIWKSAWPLRYAARLLRKAFGVSPHLGDRHL